MQRGSVPTKKSWTWLNLCCNTTWLHPCWPITQMLLCIPGRLLRIFVRVAKSHHSLTLWRVSSLETRGSVCQTGPPFHCLTSSEVRLKKWSSHCCFCLNPPSCNSFPISEGKNVQLTPDVRLEWFIPSRVRMCSTSSVAICLLDFEIQCLVSQWCKEKVLQWLK